MRAVWSSLVLFVCALAAPAQTADPKLLSVHPFTIQRGVASEIVVRGSALRGATSVFLGHAPFTATVTGYEAEPPEPTTGRKKNPADLVRVNIHASADTAPGRYVFRLVTPAGVSNALPLY